MFDRFIMQATLPKLYDGASCYMIAPVLLWDKKTFLVKLFEFISSLLSTKYMFITGSESD